MLWSCKPVRLGAPMFQPPADPDELALAHRRLGYRAAYCPNVALEDKDRIRHIARAFAKRDVVIAEVGRWCNLLDQDPERRGANLKQVTEGFATGGLVLGDVNRDGSVNGLGVGPFVDVLIDGVFDPAVDMNGDNSVNGLDVSPFVDAVIAGGAVAAPEPDAMVLLVVGFVSVGTCRRLLCPQQKGDQR